ncbi:3-methyl-2-oxobutanoate hydroxymethyltransferase [candidate division WOR-3 bacterium]|nr:3-methyl-2-oxobutanoate hydroxymethyltransferase [candidate division WOR-3 bacterium]
MKKDSKFLISKKHNQQKVTVLTCYDYPTAVLEDKAGIDIIFVGDSVGPNVLGYKSEIEVTMDDMIHHLKAVRRGVTDAYLLVDMPYKSYETPEQALKNTNIFISNGADGIKLEGAKEKVIKYLVKHGIEVAGHIGLNPQTHVIKSIQGKTFESAKELIEDALILEKAGIIIIFIELVPEEIAKIITEKISIPTIGIAAGRFCDGQVLVVNDMLGITPRKLKHAKWYHNYQDMTYQAITKYKEEVEKRLFPAEENVIHMVREELEKINIWIEYFGRKKRDYI